MTVQIFTSDWAVAGSTSREETRSGDEGLIKELEGAKWVYTIINAFDQERYH